MNSFSMRIAENVAFWGVFTKYDTLTAAYQKMEYYWNKNKVEE